MSEPGQLGGRDRQVELGDGLGVLSLLGEPAAPVGADAHDLGDVAGALGVVEGDVVEAGVGREVAVQGGEHRPRRVRRGECAVVGAAPRPLERRLDEAGARLGVAPRPADHRAPGEHACLLGEIAAVEGDRGAHLVRLVETTAQVQQAGPLAGPRRGRLAVLASLASAYSRRASSHCAALVGEVAAQLGELRVRASAFGDGQRGVEGVRWRSASRGGRSPAAPRGPAPGRRPGR